ncbi:hypothetical protein BU26DRAFT_567159 [Trematosphaeria pertusa]|uniref:EthD domain-containing protein n=1 Tax=Trematosphaeria pertusa TaxID=390896 RepID=A0A6A6I9S3_9PLEO|nr:uncharacterized protein BU26DRAFT_567159 [Trematosphaeria pertusa]KAF2246818.1 hypothetical protein BU26DRAFT_567159 [Trematosphaeria pertusa]
MADTAETECIQIVTYIKRKPTLTPAQFYDRWENVHAPKVHVNGTMVPSAATDSAPNAVSTSELPTEPVKFDGIAMFLVPSLQQFTDAFRDPYYVNVIEPDERELIDKDGPGSGVVASYQGRMLDMVHRGQSTIGNKGKKYHEVWEEWENKAKD